MRHTATVVNKIQCLPADGGDDSDGGACRPGGGTETSTL